MLVLWTPSTSNRSGPGGQLDGRPGPFRSRESLGQRAGERGGLLEGNCERLESFEDYFDTGTLARVVDANEVPAEVAEAGRKRHRPAGTCPRDNETSVETDGGGKGRGDEGGVPVTRERFEAEPARP